MGATRRSGASSRDAEPRPAAHSAAFASYRTEGDLAALVRETALDSEQPYRRLLQDLAGLGGEVDEPAARRLWLSAVAHKRVMSGALGRGVLLRVALLDLLASEQAGRRGGKPPSLMDSLRMATPAPASKLVRGDELLAIVAHEQRRRGDAPVVLALLSLERAEATSRAGDVEGEVARIVAILGELGQPMDLFARVAHDTLALLLVDGGITRARTLLRRLERELRTGSDGPGFELALALVNARPGEAAAELLLRADGALSSCRKTRRKAARLRPPRSPSVAPIAVILLSDLDAHHELHSRLAEQGCAAFPARSLAVAQALVALLSPDLLVVGNTTESLRWLARLDDEASPMRRVRLVEEGAPEAAPMSGELVIRRPLTSNEAPALLRLAIGRPTRPTLPLEGPRDANRLLRGIERLLQGTLEPPAARAVNDRPEIDVLRRHLGM